MKAVEEEQGDKTVCTDYVIRPSKHKQPLKRLLVSPSRGSTEQRVQTLIEKHRQARANISMPTIVGEGSTAKGGYWLESSEYVGDGDTIAC